MHSQTNELLRQVSRIPEVQQMKASASSALGCAAVVGASTFLGGLLGGRTGLTIGGVVSTLVMGTMASQDLQPVPLIIANMKAADKVKLASAIYELVKKNKTTIQGFIGIVMNDSLVLQTLLQIIGTFLISELGMQVSQSAH